MPGSDDEYNMCMVQWTVTYMSPAVMVFTWLIEVNVSDSWSLNTRACSTYLIKGQLTPIYLPKRRGHRGTSTGWEFNQRATLMLKAGAALSASRWHTRLTTGNRVWLMINDWDKFQSQHGDMFCWQIFSQDRQCWLILRVKVISVWYLKKKKTDFVRW